MKSTKFFITTMLFLLAFSAYSQTAKQVYPEYYCIRFTDKAKTKFSITKPEQFLSQKAIDRRTKYKIAIKENDLPVNAIYVDSLKRMGFQIHLVSKWLNSAVVKTSDTMLLKKLNTISFIRKDSWTTPKKENTTTYKKYEKIETKNTTTQKIDTLINYGRGTNQIVMLNGHYLHNKGYLGQGMMISVFDAGFYRVNTLPSFDSLWANKQILGWYDFVDRDTSVFDSGFHGMEVLSTMGANMPGKFVGTAPKANFYLCRTEQEKNEYPIEMYNWLAAAEFADSMGTDIIHCSLGYTVFDDDVSSYTFKDMNGDVAVSTIGADIAASKGILVVTSAGNEGNDPWKYVSSPADADSVLSVGAVDEYGKYAYFSSRGPSYDGRIRPNVVAQGEYAIVQGPTGKLTTQNGTSFSGPIMAGMAACFWQANPTLNNMQIIEAIQRSSSQYNKPDDYLGYGIPDFNLADMYVKNLGFNNLNDKNPLNIFPNPFSDDINIQMFANENQLPVNMLIEIFDISGKKVFTKQLKESKNTLNVLTTNEMQNIQNGVYVVRVTDEQFVYQQRMVKQ